MFYLMVVSFVWAFSFPLIKGNLAGVDSSLVSFVRLFLALLVFLPVFRTKGISKNTALKLAGIGAIQFGVMYAAYIACYKYLPAHVIALLTTTTPIFVSLVHDSLERQFHWGILVAALLAVFAGAVIRYPNQPLELSIRGVVLLQISNLAFAFGQVAYKRHMKNSAVKDAHAFALLYAGAALVTLVLTLVMTDFSALRQMLVEQQTVTTIKQLSTLAYLGVIASGVCFFLWNMGGRSVDAGTLAVMNNLKIPLAIVASLVILREETNYFRLIGGCLLMTGALYVNARLNTRTKSA